MMPRASVVALVLAVASLSCPAFAYTAAEAKNCMSDAFKLCSAQIPTVGKVAACMHAKRDQLTPACAEAVDRFFATGSINHRDKPIVYRN
jgi:hypothetical protein